MEESLQSTAFEPSLVAAAAADLGTSSPELLPGAAGEDEEEEAEEPLVALTGTLSSGFASLDCCGRRPRPAVAATQRSPLLRCAVPLLPMLAQSRSRRCGSAPARWCRPTCRDTSTRSARRLVSFRPLASRVQQLDEGAAPCEAARSKAGLALCLW